MLFAFLWLLPTFTCLGQLDDSLFFESDLPGEFFGSNTCSPYTNKVFLNYALRRSLLFFFHLSFLRGRGALTFHEIKNADDSLLRFDPSIDGTTDQLSLNSLTELLPPSDPSSQQQQALFPINSDFNTGSWLTSEIGNAGGTSSILADGTQAPPCSFESSSLPSGSNPDELFMKSRRRRGTTDQCPNPGSNDAIPRSGSEISPGSNVHPKVEPFIDLATMKLNQICPPKSPINLFTIPVCSSPVRTDTRKWDFYPYYWILKHGEISECSFCCFFFFFFFF